MKYGYLVTTSKQQLCADRWKACSLLLAYMNEMMLRIKAKTPDADFVGSENEVKAALRAYLENNSKTVNLTLKYTKPQWLDDEGVNLFTCHYASIQAIEYIE